MKKALLAVIALFLFSAVRLSAQCNPDLTMTNPGIAPDSATGLAHAVVNQFYSDTLQFRVPPDTTVIYLGNPVTFTINWIRLDDVIGLPPGFTWSTTECASCSTHTFNGNTNGCVLIQGTAPATTGTYPLQFALTANGTHIIIGTVTLPDTNTDYRIVVDPQAGIPTYNPNVFDLLQNYPNPFNGQTEIAFTTPTASKVDFRVYDLLGREIIVRNVEAVSGLNKITLSSRYFKPGIYFYKLNYKNKSLTRKMIVTAKP
jgi:Secretion system C-terminal sorting domain